MTLPPTPHTPVQAAPALPEPLTMREQEVLRLLAQGASNKEIAQQLVVSLATAKKVVRLVEGLEDNDDVQDVYANFDIPETVLEAVAS